MTTPKTPDEMDEVDRFEDALVDSILAASETDLRDEIRAAGEDPDAVICRVDALLASAQSAGAAARLREAQTNVSAFRAGRGALTPEQRMAARAKLAAARAADPTLSAKTLLAARNGQGATERDLDSLIDDFAELERLERETGETDPDAG